MSEFVKKVNKFNQKQIDIELKKALDFKPDLQNEIEEIIKLVCDRLNPVAAFSKNGEISAQKLIHLLLSARSALITEIINNHNLRKENHFLKNKEGGDPPLLDEDLLVAFRDMTGDGESLN